MPMTEESLQTGAAEATAPAIDTAKIGSLAGASEDVLSREAVFEIADLSVRYGNAVALKETSLVSVIAGGDILGTAQDISGYNFRTIELLIVAAIWYLLVTSAATLGQGVVERRISRGFTQRKRRPRSVEPVTSGKGASS